MADYFMIGIDPVLESSLPRYDPNSGLYWEECWKGSRGAIDRLIGSLNLDRNDTDQRYDVDDADKPLFRVRILTPDYNDGRNNAINKFELVHNKVEKDLYEHPLVKANLTAAQVDKVRQTLKNMTTLGTVTFDNATQALLYNKVLKGSNRFMADERVFRFSVVTSKRFGSYISEVGLFKIWTTDQLINPAISGLIIPAGILFNLALVGANNLYGSTFSQTQTVGGVAITETYAWTWMKQPPDIEQLPSGKLRITQEWWLDYWPTWEYVPYVP